MFEESMWLPLSKPITIYAGHPLPLMPTKPIPRAAFQYAPKQIFDLLPHDRNIEKIEKVKEQDAKGVQIEIIRSLDIGYDHLAQIVVAKVTEGREEILGKNLVVQFYDPLYVSPGTLGFVRFIGNTPLNS
jgi:hypothetical protein